ncbi:MAG TPA: enoyl-CoA hydratase/isomerase family protein [Thermoanaerobaculia bacterium]|nr:enoyl-CoA hydratase/isomerase family protein [Thermoanaerobaculia bacterium]
MFEYEEKDGIIILTLAHGKASAMDLELMEALDRTVDELHTRNARAVVLTGRGSIFSAGVDLFRVVNEGEPYLRRFLPALNRGLERFFKLDIPVVAACNGHAIAGGCLLVQSCDYRLMAAGNGKIGVPELLVGVPFPTSAFEILRFVVPPNRLQEVALTGRTYTAPDALERGLIDEIAAPEMLMERALSVATQMAAIPSASFAATKRLARRDAVARFGSADEAINAIWSRTETIDTIRTYLDKTVGPRK